MKRKNPPKPFRIRETHLDIAAVVLHHPNGIQDCGISMELHGDLEFWHLHDAMKDTFNLMKNGWIDYRLYLGYVPNGRTLLLFDKLVEAMV